MSDVTALRKRRKGMIKQLFAMVKNDERLTEPISIALDIYVDYMLQTRGTTNISPELLKSDIDKLLMFNCNRQLALISKYDVERVEDAIIVDIKRAIQCGGIKYLNYSESAEEALQQATNIMQEYYKQHKKILTSNVDAFGKKINKEEMKELLDKLEVF